jgi:hypothetical protein
MHFLNRLLLSTFTLCSSLALTVNAQKKYQVLHLPDSINSVNEEFSGMALFGKRLYLLPQYGNHKDSKLDGLFSIYSIGTDSLKRNIDGKDSCISNYRTIYVTNLDKLPDSIKQYYEGFEAIAFVGNQVYLSIETVDSSDYCFLIKGMIDTANNKVTIDPVHTLSLRRYPYIKNAGFESLTYLQKEKKLIALYEFNAMPNGGIGYLIDPSFSYKPKKISIPFLHFRITDAQANSTGKIYALNYHYGGDYKKYLNNDIIRHQEENIKSMVHDLKGTLIRDPDFLKIKSSGYARIVMMNSYKAKSWKQVATFDPFENNWEGLILFEEGALIITDANRSKLQLSTLSYVEF